MRNQRMTRVMMAVGSAAVLFAAGSARAAEPTYEANASAKQESVRDARGGEPSAPAPTMREVVDGDRSGFVTHDELQKQTQAIYERLEREQNARNPTPTFTDAG
jgi:hypothetical protein